MPMHDYHCPACSHEFERFLHVSECDSAVFCEQCGASADRAYVYQRPHSYGGLTDPVVVYKNPDGTYGIPGTRDARIPEGSERIELRSAADVRRVEREMTQHEYSKFVSKQEREEQTFGAAHAEKRAELREKMRNFSERGKAFARVAMQQNDNAHRKRFQTNTFFDAFSNDASNRDGYRGEDHRLGRK